MRLPWILGLVPCECIDDTDDPGKHDYWSVISLRVTLVQPVLTLDSGLSGIRYELRTSTKVLF